MTKEYTPTVKERAWELHKKEAVLIAKLGPMLKKQFGLTKTPDSRSCKRWVDDSEAARAKDSEIPVHLARTSEQYSANYDLVDIPEMEWTIDELHRRQVPIKEARKLLKTYYSLVNHPRRMFTPLKADPFYLVLCFTVKLYQDYPNIHAHRVNRLARIYFSGMPASRRIIDEVLASESRKRRFSWLHSMISNRRKEGKFSADNG